MFILQPKVEIKHNKPVMTVNMAFTDNKKCNYLQSHSVKIKSAKVSKESHIISKALEMMFVWNFAFEIFLLALLDKKNSLHVI